MIPVLAIDDEPLALQQMIQYIARIPFLELAGTARSAAEAERLLAEKKVQAVFLDIHLAGDSGLELIRRLPHPPLVVFTTAYAVHAVEGFRVNAVDYLLKPISFNDFLSSAERLRMRLGQQEVQERLSDDAPKQDAFFVRAEHKNIRVAFEDIRYIESMGEYVKIHRDSDPAPLLVLMRLKQIAAELPADRFLRIHRSYILPLQRLKELKKGEAVLKDGTALPVGDLYLQGLKDYLNRLRIG